MAGADDHGEEDGPKRGARASGSPSPSGPASNGSAPDGAPAGGPAGGTVVNAERMRLQGDRIREIERLMWGARAFAGGDDSETQAD
ncbi:hypothetical protein [Nitrospirillum pindoramense]|uniref:Uncharacterized protein n=1 Tax=Nitrospirillum amazonense TaxID=28077 RepID=A0A560H6P7_9PROT|nr:hypothetical protein [Nitrospirillum amazonense]TWB41986.1 hypothetical protein FBZ90_107365 [Nitrospirillum amazonense]